MREPSIKSAEPILQGEGAAGHQEDFLAAGERSAAINSLLPQRWRHVPRRVPFGKTKIIAVKIVQKGKAGGTSQLQQVLLSGCGLCEGLRDLRCARRDLGLSWG